MRFEIETWSLQASYRDNQDSIEIQLLNDGQLLLAAVADGVGGNDGGEIASRIAVETATASLSSEPHKNFADLFKIICSNLAAEAAKDTTLSDMATTLTIITAKTDSIHFGHVGDTRLYHLRGDGLIQRTKDQTEASLLVEQGIISPRKAKTYARKSVLISALSPTGEFDLQEGSFDIRPSDRILILSDGLYRHTSKLELRDLSKQSSTLKELSQLLYDKYSTQLLEDDASIVLIEVSQ